MLIKNNIHVRSSQVYLGLIFFCKTIGFFSKSKAANKIKSSNRDVPNEDEIFHFMEAIPVLAKSLAAKP